MFQRLAISSFGTLALVAGLGQPAAAQVASPATRPAATVQQVPAAAVRPVVATVAAAPADAVRALLVPRGETTLSSPVAGTIRSLGASLGSSFGAGQVLVEFECGEPRARLGIAEAELSGAVEQHEAKVRMHGLDQASDVEVALAASAVAKARAQISLTQAQIAQCTVRAPWSGRVARLHARSHMSVTPGQPLLDLVQAGALKLKLNAPSRSVQQIRPGSVLSVAVDETGKSYTARVVSVNSRIDPASQTVEMEAQLSAPHSELLPGMSGVVSFGGAL